MDCNRVRVRSQSTKIASGFVQLRVPAGKWSDWSLSGLGMANTESFDSVDFQERLSGELAVGFDVDKLSVLNRSRIFSEGTRPTGSPVQLSRVSTYVMGAKGGFTYGYIVSAMGSHWGVVVGGPKRSMLYHLVFYDRADRATDANPDSLTGRVRAVKFDATLWKPEMSEGASMLEVGKTPYSIEELLEIGRNGPC